MPHSLDNPPPATLRDRLAGVLIHDGYGVADAYDAADAALRELDRPWHERRRGDDAPTAKLPPIGQTVRRRPPVPPPAVVHELQGADLLRAIAEELDRQDTAELHAVRGDEDCDVEPGTRRHGAWCVTHARPYPHDGGDDL